MLEAYIKAVDSMKITPSEEVIRHIDTEIKVSIIENNIALNSAAAIVYKNEYIKVLIEDCKKQLCENKNLMNRNMVRGRAQDFTEVSESEQEKIDEEMQVLFIKDKELKERYHYLKQLSDNI